MRVRSIDRNDKADAIGILAEAFRGDPIMSWISDKPGFVRLMFDVTLPVFFAPRLLLHDRRQRGRSGVAGAG